MPHAASRFYAPSAHDLGLVHSALPTMLFLRRQESRVIAFLDCFVGTLSLRAKTKPHRHTSLL